MKDSVGIYVGEDVVYILDGPEDGFYLTLSISKI